MDITLEWIHQRIGELYVSNIKLQEELSKKMLENEELKKQIVTDADGQ